VKPSSSVCTEEIKEAAYGEEHAGLLASTSGRSMLIGAGRACRDIGPATRTLF
jgi:hypothetical protein